MTKREFAQLIVDKELKSGITHVTQSSSYAVAADFLGLLNPRDSTYAKSRGGVLVGGVINGEYMVLTVRDVIEMLPE